MRGRLGSEDEERKANTPNFNSNNVTVKNVTNRQQLLPDLPYLSGLTWAQFDETACHASPSPSWPDAYQRYGRLAWVVRSRARLKVRLKVRPRDVAAPSAATVRAVVLSRAWSSGIRD